MLISFAYTAQFSISVNPAAQSPLRDGPAISCPAEARADNPENVQPDIPGKYFEIPPIQIKWNSSDQSFIINGATVTAHLPSGQRHVCNITTEDIQDSLLPFYWFANNKRQLDPSDSGKSFPQLCRLKCGNFSASTKGVRYIPATVMLRGYTVGGKISEDLMAQASFMVVVTH